MTLTAPQLDNRTFQSLVDEAKTRIPHYFDSWTDHNVSDPGVTLIELFAWMTEMLIYRQNQVPDLHLVKFMEFMGLELTSPKPATASITFWLSAPVTQPLKTSQTIEVASTQTENEPSIIFTTERPLSVDPAALTTLFLGQHEEGHETFTSLDVAELADGLETAVPLFSNLNGGNDALYLGFSNDLSHHVLQLELNCVEAGGLASQQRRPPYRWEVSGPDAGTWQPADLDPDGDQTGSMNRPGKVELHLPAMGRTRVHNRDGLYWVRARLLTPTERGDDIQRYRTSPSLKKITAASIGCTIPAHHAVSVQRELVGHSDGAPGQRFYLQRTPVILPLLPEENLRVIYPDGRSEQWQYVSDFGSSSEQDRHYTLDSASGEIRFGPAVRQSNGVVRFFGMIPPRGAAIFFTRYRTHSGQDGNVRAGTLNTLKTAIPFVDRVLNRYPALGGRQLESIAHLRERAPKELRTGDRAVTEADYEFLARRKFPELIGRVKCLQPRPTKDNRVRPGYVYLLVIPRVPQPYGPLDPADLTVNPQMLATLQDYLDERRLLTTRLQVREPEYHIVFATVHVLAAKGADHKAIEEEVKHRLYRFINPLTGSLSGDGWPFGRDLYAADIYPVLQDVPGVVAIRQIDLYNANAIGEREETAVSQIQVIGHGTILSAPKEKNDKEKNDHEVKISEVS